MPTSVLVVDDSQDLLAFLVSVLEDEGYTVIQAADGKPALDRLRQVAVELVVLLDLHMPALSGFAMLRAVEVELPLRTRHAYIVLSAAQGKELPPDFRAQVERLYSPVLDTPFAVRDLLAAVAAAERMRGQA